jgi:hypothetical protein
MDPLRFCLAFVPLAAYFVALAGVHLRRRPVMVSGFRDSAALALALSGLAIVGPVELFFPREAGVVFAQYVWLLLGALYGLGVLLVLLAERPRLVIYDLTLDELRPLLARACERVDPTTRWAGQSLSLPGAGMELRVDPSWLRTISIRTLGATPPPEAWRRLHAALCVELREVRGRRNLPAALVFGGLGMLLAAATLTLAARHPREIAQAMVELLRM